MSLDHETADAGAAASFTGALAGDWDTTVADAVRGPVAAPCSNPLSGCFDSSVAGDAVVPFPDDAACDPLAAACPRLVGVSTFNGVKDSSNDCTWRA